MTVVTSDSLERTHLWLQPTRFPSPSQPRFLCSLHGKPTSPPEPRAHGMLRRWQRSVEGARLPESPWPQYSLSGVQSVKRGTSRGTLSMCCRCGRTWWMPLGSLAWRKQRNQWPQGQREGSLNPPLLHARPTTCHLQGRGRPCHRTRLQSSRKLGRSLSVGWKLMRSEWPSSSTNRSPSASSRDTVGIKACPSLQGQPSGGLSLPCSWHRTACLQLSTLALPTAVTRERLEPFSKRMYVSGGLHWGSS